jgi:hypothetical protein
MADTPGELNNLTDQMVRSWPGQAVGIMRT